MAFTGYTKTEQNVTTTKGAKSGWLIVDTTINQAVIFKQICTGMRSTKNSAVTPTYNRVYCHLETPTEPAGDGQILTSVFDDAETEYSGGAGYIKSFTSEAGIFTANQNFGSSETLWIIYYNAKGALIDEGYAAWIQFEFYKRNTSNVDTSLFNVKVDMDEFYSVTGYSTTVAPSGTVTTDDRLRIRVKVGESLSA